MSSRHRQPTSTPQTGDGLLGTGGGGRQALVAFRVAGPAVDAVPAGDHVAAAIVGDPALLSAAGVGQRRAAGVPAAAHLARAAIGGDAALDAGAAAAMGEGVAGATGVRCAGAAGAAVAGRGAV